VNAIPPNLEPETRWSLGLLNDSILSLFAGEKYALVEDPRPFQRALQYEFVKQYEKDFLFRNARFLPLGLTFDHYITQDVFLRLPPREKPAALLYAVVLSGKNEADKLGVSEANISDIEEAARNFSFTDMVAARRKAALELTSFRQNRIEGTVRLEQKSVLVLQTPFDSGWRALQDGQAALTLKADVGLLGVALDAGEHKVELRYSTPFLGLAFAISLASLALFAFSAWRWPRFPLVDEA
jgi:uncharacterized membrane protein YfhO